MPKITNPQNSTERPQTGATDDQCPIGRDAPAKPASDDLSKPSERSITELPTEPLPALALVSQFVGGTINDDLARAEDDLPAPEDNKGSAEYMQRLSLTLAQTLITGLSALDLDNLQPATTIGGLEALRLRAQPLLLVMRAVEAQWAEVEKTLKESAANVFPDWREANPGERTLAAGVTMRVSLKPAKWSVKDVEKALADLGKLESYRALDKAKVIRAVKDRQLDLGEVLVLVEEATPAVSRSALLDDCYTEGGSND